MRNQPIQKQNSILCGLFCIYFAHNFFSVQKLVKMSDFDFASFCASYDVLTLLTHIGNNFFFKI